MLKYFLLEQFLFKDFLLEQLLLKDFLFLYNFVTHYYWVTNNTSYIFTIFAAICCRIPKKPFFAHKMFFWIFTITLTVTVIPLLIWATFLLSNLHSHLHDTSFVNVLDSFILVIILKAYKFKSSLSFRTHTPLNRSSRVLQLLAHLPILTADR